MNQSYEESRTKENDSDYQSSKLNYLQKKPINDFTPVNNFEPLKYEKPEEKETKLFSSYQELEL